MNTMHAWTKRALVIAAFLLVWAALNPSVAHARAHTTNRVKIVFDSKGPGIVLQNQFHTSTCFAKYLQFRSGRRVKASEFRRLRTNTLWLPKSFVGRHCHVRKAKAHVVAKHAAARAEISVLQQRVKVLETELAKLTNLPRLHVTPQAVTLKVGESSPVEIKLDDKVLFDFVQHSDDPNTVFIEKTLTGYAVRVVKPAPQPMSVFVLYDDGKVKTFDAITVTIKSSDPPTPAPGSFWFLPEISLLERIPMPWRTLAYWALFIVLAYLIVLVILSLLAPFYGGRSVPYRARSIVLKPVKRVYYVFRRRYRRGAPGPIA